MTAESGLRARYPDLLADDEDLLPQVAALDAWLGRGEPPAGLSDSIARTAAEAGSRRPGAASGSD